jgi:hypothetical protein
MFRINYLIHHQAFVQDKPQEHSVHLFLPVGFHITTNITTHIVTVKIHNFG